MSGSSSRIRRLLARARHLQGDDVVAVARLVADRRLAAEALAGQPPQRSLLLEQVDRVHRGPLDLVRDARTQRALDAHAIDGRKFLDGQQPLEEVPKTDVLLLHGLTCLLAGCPAVHVRGALGHGGCLEGMSCALSVPGVLGRIRV
jgi:NAD(P)-dependent dehydrogenase (short-subunit alcohol dehydrogenase family)